jgi:hypothetical protein
MATARRPYSCANYVNVASRTNIWFSITLARNTQRTKGVPSSSRIGAIWVFHFLSRMPSMYNNFVISAVLMELLAECFPRILCRARDCLFEAIGRLTAWAECQGHAQLQCRLCPASVPAQKNALYSHLNAHPSYRSFVVNIIFYKNEFFYLLFQSDAKSANSHAPTNEASWSINGANILESRLL